MPITQAQIDRLKALNRAEADELNVLVADTPPASPPKIVSFTATPVVPEPVPPEPIPPDPLPTLGSLQYVSYVATNVQDDPRISCWYGKHVQGVVVGKLLYLYGGDGDWRFPEVNYAQNQSLNSVMVYDFSQGGKLTRPRGQLGDAADGTVPFYHDGCTWAFNSQERRIYAMPGYQPPFGANQTVQAPYSERGIFHLFNVDAGKWERGHSRTNGLPSTDPGFISWPQEHWGGCYDLRRNRIWIQTTGTGEFGALRWFDCAPQTFGKQNMVGNKTEFPAISGVINAGGLDTDHWCQRYNPVTDELICYDGYRGLIVAIPLAGPSYKPRVVAQVAAVKAGLSGEPIRTVEMGFSISVARQKAFLSCSRQNYYIKDGVGGIWVADLTTGAVEHADYPMEAGGTIISPPGSQTQVPVADGVNYCQYTACEYIDHPDVDALILWDNIVDASRVWGRRFLKYQFKE